MSEINTGRGKTWNNIDKDDNGQWKSFGSSSMDAISFGFVATAILISMFLIMALFEHLFLPNASPSNDEESHISSTSSNSLQNQEKTHEAASGFSVVMPGQNYPTFIAQPAPLLPPSCPREGLRWPSHVSLPQHNAL